MTTEPGSDPFNHGWVQTAMIDRNFVCDHFTCVRDEDKARFGLYQNNSQVTKHGWRHNCQQYHRRVHCVI